MGGHGRPSRFAGLPAVIAIHHSQVADRFPRVYQHGDGAVLFQRGLREPTQGHLNQSEAVKGSIT